MSFSHSRRPEDCQGSRTPLVCLHHRRLPFGSASSCMTLLSLAESPHHMTRKWPLSQGFEHIDGDRHSHSTCSEQTHDFYPQYQSTLSTHPRS